MAKTPGLFVPSTAIQANALTSLGICPRHANPAVRAKKRTYYSATPPWVFLLIFAGLLIALIVMVAIRKTVAGQVPDCETCVAEQRKRSIIGWSLALGSVVLVLLGISASQDAITAVGVLALVAALLYPVAAPRKWANGVVTKDGYWVEFKKTAPAFQAAVQQQVAAATPTPVLPQWGPPTPQA